jgi:hypothetical protein
VASDKKSRIGEMHTLNKKNYTPYLIFALALPIVVFISRFVIGGFDVTHFIVAGDQVVEISEHPYPLKVLKNSNGYDGTLFYQLALDPTITDEYAFGIRSNLAYRKQRILYPAIAHITALGQPQLVPYAMVLVNLICIMIAIFLAYKIARENNSDPAYILLFAGLVGFYIGLTRNLAETMEGLFLTLTFFFFIKKRYIPLGIAMTCALLTRETSLFIVGSLSVIVLYSNLKERKLLSWNSILVLVPILVLALWKLYLYQQFGGYSSERFEIIPFKGIYEALMTSFSGALHPEKYGSSLHLLYGVYCFFLLAWMLYTMSFAFKHIKLKKDKLNLWVGFSLVCWFILTLFFYDKIFMSDLGFGRIYHGIMTISILFLIKENIKLSRMYFLATAAIYVVSIGRLVVMT